MTTASLFQMALAFEAAIDQRDGTPLAHQAQTVTVGPVQAQEALDKYNFVGQRPRKRSHVLLLAEELKMGTFRPFTPIDFAVLDGQPHLVNGQHTLDAVVESEVPYSFCINFHRVENKRALESLYSKYDIGRPRTMIDLMGTIGVDLDLSNTERNALSKAMAIVLRDFRAIGSKFPAQVAYLQKSADVRKDAMREWLPEAKTLFALVEGTPCKKVFFRAPVLAVALVTLRSKPGAANDFWRESSRDSNLKRGDPRKTFLDWMTRHERAKITHHALEAAICCWNAWDKGLELFNVRTQMETKSQIPGTPFTRNFKA